ncbi:helix-loop-helix DNA-binding domain-containing protein [Xylariaceae sp. FL0255]|nr:helix-loop-helix DNA-binding domain-containing protein [Xylariaceae sp. FL0255]
MDARAMQDIDVYTSTAANGVDNLFDNSADFTQQFAATNFWETLDQSSASSFANSTAATPSLQSTSANSPASTTSAEPTYHPPKHSLLGKSKPKKRRCSSESKQAQSVDHSTLDCSDYWLRFDSDSEIFDQYLDNDPQDAKNVGLFDYSLPPESEQRGLDVVLSSKIAELCADTQVRSPPSISRPLLRASKVAALGDTIKVAHPPTINDLIDDSALDQALSDEDELLSLNLAQQFGESSGGDTTPPDTQERLYSTPLSWEPPRPGFHMDYMNMGLPSTDAERRRLLAIAMGTANPQTMSAARPPTSEFRFEMPKPNAKTVKNTVEDAKAPITTPRPTGSRKNSQETAERPKLEKPKNPDRTAHNDIERKYRTNLKDKITELRDAVPALRSIPEDDDGNSPVASPKTAPKVSKGTVLTKATEYIHQLERRNRSMTQKNEELARRLQAFEQLVGVPTGPNWRPEGYGGGPSYNPRY